MVAHFLILHADQSIVLMASRAQLLSVLCIIHAHAPSHNLKVFHIAATESIVNNHAVDSDTQRQIHPQGVETLLLTTLASSSAKLFKFNLMDLSGQPPKFNAFVEQS